MPDSKITELEEKIGYVFKDKKSYFYRCYSFVFFKMKTKPKAYIYAATNGSNF